MANTRISNVRVVSWQETCDHPTIVIGHHGEDPALVLREYRKEQPQLDRNAAIIFSYGVMPRRGLCTAASVAAALPLVAGEIGSLPPDEAKNLRDNWVGLCEGLSVACKTALGVK